MLWRVRGRRVSQATNFVGIQSCPTPPRHPAVRPDPTRPWYVPVLDSTSASKKIQKFIQAKTTMSESGVQITDFKFVQQHSKNCISAVTCRIRKSRITRAGRVVAHGAVAGRFQAELPANRSIRLEINPSSHPPKHRRHIA